MTAAALILLLVLQDRGAPERQTLVELAGVLGEAHALRQVCRGPDDDFWRSRMMRMLETEDADFAFSERLRGAFNTGYLARQQQHSACTPQARRAEAEVAGRGQALSRRLAPAPTPPTPPSPLAPPIPPPAKAAPRAPVR